MSLPSRSRLVPTPAPTPPPIPAPTISASKRKRRIDRRSTQTHVDRRSRFPSLARQQVADEDQVLQAEQDCQVFSGNNITTCFPIASTSIPQHEVAALVWNSNLPQFTQTNLLNIYLFDASTNSIIHSWPNQTNPRGRSGVLHFPVNDTWFGTRGLNWNGQPTNFIYYWVVTRNDVSVDVGIPQPIFTAVQTTFADAVVSSMSSASVASAASAASVSSAIQASLSSESAAHATATSTGGPGAGGSNPSVQGNASGSSFPHWAIAVIVVLGVLALLAGGILTFFILRRIRRRQGADLSHRGSMGSAAPMMANAQTGNPHSPLMGAAVLAGAGGSHHRPTSPDMHDGASTMSRGSDSAPFSGADAAVMADAFRAALRKPNFADRPVEEGESPDDHNSTFDQAPTHPAEFMLSQQLAEEGRDIRSVSSSRGVKVETLSDHNDGDTISDRPQ
ncbi:hypothetical protein C8Q75DRAFT_246366 [Abortiporus biennis]|nr:hypothetical protein C8Q75DRAFT_246366 [Abortiporus biennis]